MTTGKREWRWLCVACWTEGRGCHPDECPGCGDRQSWYLLTADVDDPQTARESFEQRFPMVPGGWMH